MTKREKVLAYLDTDQLEALRTIARATDAPVAALIRRAVAQFLASFKKSAAAGK